MLVILPIIEGQWYQASMVPVDVLRSSYIQTAWGIMIIIVVACSLFYMADEQTAEDGCE